VGLQQRVGGVSEGCPGCSIAIEYAVQTWANLSRGLSCCGLDDLVLKLLLKLKKEWRLRLKSTGLAG
jgi:hypothetical protein